MRTLLDEDTADDLLRKTIFSSVSVARLAESVEKVNELARPQDTNFQDEMVEQYGRVRRFCPHYCAICTSVRPQTVNIPWLPSITWQS